MRFVQISVLATLVGCTAHGAGADAPTKAVAQVVLSRAPSCACVEAPGGANRTFDCSAQALPEGSSLCQVGPRGLHCAPEGEQTQMFTGEVACEPGFCISGDGKTCLVSCGCEP